jgi:hypothetical protein
MQHVEGCSPLALDGDVCAVSCFNASHIQATVLHATNKNDLIPCGTLVRRKLRVEMAFGRAPVCELRR